MPGDFKEILPHDTRDNIFDLITDTGCSSLPVLRIPSIPTADLKGLKHRHAPLMILIVLSMALPVRGQAVTAFRTETQPVIDGNLDEDVWNLAEPVTGDFIQHRPDCGEAMTEPTEIRILYDDSAIYFAFRMHDPYPEQFTRVLCPRDYDVSTEWIGIWLDTFNDDNNAYFFFVSLENSRQDGRLCRVGGWDVNWDAVWESGTASSDSGWTAEFAIPFSAIRYPSDTEQIWGINFKRTITRTNESAFLFRMADNGCIRIEDFGNLQGLHNLPSSRHIELRPYGATRLRYISEEDNVWDPWASIGADIKIGISSNAALDLTLNPDFGQVEADPDEVNLSHWETFLSEKRPFFLEGSDLFHMPFNLFYSRRIGTVASNGEIIPILGGVKLTGSSQGFRFGLLDAYTGRIREDGGLLAPETNYAAGRIVKEFGDGTYIGTSLTSTDNRPQDSSEYAYGRSGAMDGQIKFLEYHSISGAVAETWNSGDAEWKDNSACRGCYSFEDERFDCAAGFDYMEDSFDANMIGYTSSTGAVNTWARAGLYHLSSNSSVLQQWWSSISCYYDQIPGGAITGRGAHTGTGIAFRNRYDFNINIGYNGSWTDRYEGPDGTEYDGGMNFCANCSSDSRRKLFICLWGGTSSWCEGTNTWLGSWINYKPAPHISLEADLDWSGTDNARKYSEDTEDWDRRDTDWRSVEIGGTWMFSNTLSLKLTSQVSRFVTSWDQTGSDSSNSHWMNLLLSWQFKPGSMFYIMAGENADPDEDGWYNEPELTVYSKLTWFLPL